MYERREFYGYRQQDVADYLGIRENKKEKNEGRKWNVKRKQEKQNNGNDYGNSGYAAFVRLWQNTLKGTYESVDGKYSIEFNSDKTCTWYQSGTFFEGSYEYDEDEEVYVLEIVGSGFYASTIFEAELEDGNLIVNGGACNDTVFEKQ